MISFINPSSIIQLLCVNTPLVGSVAGPQLKNSRDCLSKTQVCANTKVDVYGLTPAQCRKVKEICSRSELKPR
jgi:hypothetical protein